MRFEKTRQLYDYWSNLKGTRLAPGRSEIKSADIRSLSGDIFILEVDHDAQYVIYHLAGACLCADYGRELQGVGYLTFWAEENSLDILHAINRVYSNYTPYIVSHQARKYSGRPTEYETLLLPLQTCENDARRILGISTPENLFFRQKKGLIFTNRLHSIRPVRERKKTRSTDSIPCMSSTVQRKTNHLTLLEGGKV